MITQEVEQKLKEITDKIVKEYQPEKIILFGSYAWGKPHKWSDVDLFVVKESEKNPLECMREVKGIIFGTDLPTDILVYTPGQVEKRQALGDPFIKRILKNGHLLYAQR